MKIGIISDTHDNLPAVNKAIVRLNQERVELVLHAGDYIAPFTVAKFKELKATLIGVLGNNDGDHVLLTKRFSEIENAEIRDHFAEVEVEGLKIALLHGQQEELLRSLIKTGSFDVVIHGHSHKPEIREEGGTKIINPGEICGYLNQNSTMALLDTATREAEIVRL